MDQDKKLRISADATQVESVFKRIQQTAQESANVLMQEAERRKGSSKEMLKYLEEEIKAMERVNRLYTERRTLETKQQMIQRPGDKGLQGEMQQIRIEDREGRLHTELLRDIVDAIIRTSKEEVEENRKGTADNVSRTPASSRDFKTRLQASLLGMENVEDGKKLQDRDVSTGRFASGTRGYGAAVIGANNPADAGFNIANMAGSQMMMSGLPIAGMIVGLGAMMGKKIFDTYQQYSRAEGQSYAMMGRNSTDAGTGYSAWGYSGTDFMTAQAAMARTRRSGVGSEAATRNQLMLERGIGLDRGLYGSAEQLSMVGGGSGYSNIQSSIAAMRAAGIVKGNDMSSVSDYLQVMVQVGKEQLTRLGKVDVGINSKMVASLANMDENLKKSPEALTTMVNAIRGGLSGGSAQAQALQYSVLSKMAPGSSMFELQEMREDPFSQKSQKYLPEFLKQLRNMSGSDDRFFQNIQSQFGLSASMSRKLGEGYTSGRLSEVIDKDFSGKEGLSDAEKRAAEATSWKDSQTANLDNLQIRAAEKTIETTDKLNSWLDKQNKKQSDYGIEQLKSDNKLRQLWGGLVLSRSVTSGL